MKAQTALVFSSIGKFEPVPMRERIGALAVTKALRLRDKWMVTHLPTGCSIAGPVSRKQAVAFLKIVAPACDWDAVNIQTGKDIVPAWVREKAGRAHLLEAAQ